MARQENVDYKFLLFGNGIYKNRNFPLKEISCYTLPSPQKTYQIKKKKILPSDHIPLFPPSLKNLPTTKIPPRAADWFKPV